MRTSAELAWMTHMGGRDVEPGSRALVGTSGFSYGDWKGAFYPTWLPSRDWFHYYATRFRSIEVNLTFYRSPTAAMLGRWLASPPEFHFVLKASQVITHQKRLAGCEAELAQLVAQYSPMGSRLACILFQLPPSLCRDDSLLKHFVERTGSLLEGAEIAPALVFEFRHPSWNVQATLKLLVRHGCTMVIHDMAAAAGWQLEAGKLKAGSIVCTSAELLDLPLPLLYLRFHGTSGKYIGEYGTGRLEPWAQLARAALDRSIPAHAYFNNTHAAAAVRDASQFAELIGG